MKKLTGRIMLLGSILLAIQGYWTAAQAKGVSEQDLHKCYAKYPFLVDLLVNVSDEDFKDSNKRVGRVTDILDGIKKNPENVQSCLSKIKSFAKNTEDLNTVQFVDDRLKEVTQFQVLYLIPRLHEPIEVGQNRTN